MDLLTSSFVYPGRPSAHNTRIMATYHSTLRAAPNTKPAFFFNHQSFLNVSLGTASPSSHAVSSVKAAAGECRTTTKHHPAWSNVRQERWEGHLAVEGHLPTWLNGTYLRNGPGLWDVGEHSSDHVFDGYATLVRVSFRRGRATGAHRQVESDAYKAAMAHGRPLHREFSQIISHNHHQHHHQSRRLRLLDRVRDVVGLGTGALLSDNANISVLPLGDGRVMCLTETTKSSLLIDPETLDTIGKFRYADRLWGLLQSTHPVVTTAGTGGEELLTLLPDDMVFRRGHRVVRMAAGSNERKVIGRVRSRGRRGGHAPAPALAPGWVHSFAVTDKYIVVPEMPLRYSLTGLLKSELTPWYIFDWLPESGSYMHVICRFTGNTVASVEVPPFMALHFINAYEQRGAIIADCCEYYADPSVIKALTLHRLRSPPDRMDKDAFPDSRIARFRIPLDGNGNGTPMGELEAVLDPEMHGRGVEMPSIHPAYQGKDYRYVYACCARRPCNFFNCLTKIDLVEKEAKNWHQFGSVPSEPFFVPRPGATHEDDGVVISIVSTMDGDGYVLLLDAVTFEEIARVRLPYGLPYGFHGCWIPESI